MQIDTRFLVFALLLLTGCSDHSSAPPEPARTTEPQPAAQPPDNRPLIVAFGDSLTAGFGADPGKSYPDFLQQILDHRGYSYHVVNAGVSGETTTDALARLTTITALKPAVAIVEFGGND